jgi:hypothetical protein
MKESVARTKQCRQIISVMQPIQTASIASPNDPPAFGIGVGNCVGSVCMGWRNELSLDTSLDPAGYCGFAGKP